MTALIIVGTILVLSFVTVLIWLRVIHRRPMDQVDRQLSATDQSIMRTKRAMRAEQHGQGMPQTGAGTSQHRVPAQRTGGSLPNTTKPRGSDELSR